MVKQGKKAGTDFAVRCKPHARAVSAKRMRDRRDNADFALAVVERVTPRGLAEFIGKLPHGTKSLSFSRISSIGTTTSGDQTRSSSSGMNSMKRTTTPSSREKRANSTIWSSLNPRRRTQLTFTGSSLRAWRHECRQAHCHSHWDAGDAGELFGINGVHADGGATRPASLSG